MLLQELFDSHAAVPWKWTEKRSDEAEAIFTVGKVDYIFFAYHESMEDGNEWDIEFRVAEGANRFGLTGTGNSQKVLTTVIAIIEEFLRIYSEKIDKLAFTAKEVSRIDLYSKMVHRLLPTWKLEKSDTHPTNPTHNKQKFLLTAPKKIGAK
jgi:hypothetical protein